MKRNVTKLLSLILVLVLVLTGCGKTKTDTNGKVDEKTEKTTTDDKGKESTEKSADSIKDLVLPRLSNNEMETFNILYSQKAPDLDVITNLVDGLLEVDEYGELVPGIAEEWGTDDNGLTWTFKIRDGVKWVDMNGEEKADTISDDFATGLEWVLNFHKNDSNNTSMPTEMIKGATEYYEYTKSLSKEEAEALNAGEGSKFREMVGLETPDEKTVIYHCITEKPYFDTVAPYACLYPMSQGMVDELGSVENVKAMNNENMWYNGCYTMTQFIQGNEKIFTKNPLYWDKEADLFDTVTVKIVESNDVAFQLYQSNEVDYVQLTESNIRTLYDNKDHEFHDYLVPDVPQKYSYHIHYNYDKNNEDGTKDVNWNTAIANKNFRLALYNGINFEEYYKRTNAIDPFACENNFFTMKGLIYTSDGTDYTELVREEMGLPEPDGKKLVKFNKEEAEEYKAKAIEELTALGVTFPVEVDYYISGENQSAMDTAKVLSNIFSENLGDDFVKLVPKTYVSKITAEVLQPHLHSFAITGWGADYGDPQNFLSQVIYGNDNAYHSTSYSFINDVEETEATKDLIDTYKEYTKMVAEADAITDNLDNRYAAYAKAEAYFLENGLALPTHYLDGWSLSRIETRSRMTAMFGNQNDKMKNWRTKEAGYTTEEAAIREEEFLKH